VRTTVAIAEMQAEEARELLTARGKRRLNSYRVDSRSCRTPFAMFWQAAERLMADDIL
jgi:hypothetical protein